VLRIPLLATLLLAAAPAEYEGDAPGECTDRADNDRDGTFDCLDTGCAGSPDCQKKLTINGVESGAPLSVGQSVQAWALVTAGGAVLPNPAVSWATSAPEVFTVTSAGVVRAMGPGRATLTARAGDATASVAVHVAGEGSEPMLAPLGYTEESAREAAAAPANTGTPSASGDPIILGTLDKSVITAVIRRNMNQVRYCYQRELTKDPDLAGRVMVKFVIARDGTVSSATTVSSTMNNAAVESCINQRFMRFQFPEPKGGGIVIVSYPFTFVPG
jgi:hypothetical protein